MTETGRVAAAMGGPAVLRRAVRSPRDLEALVARGLPRQALDACVARVWPEKRAADRFKFSLVPRATYHRRRVLSAAASERVERVARIVALAEQAWAGDPAGARDFLTRAHALLEGRAPVEAARTELGARRVEDLIAGLVHGLPV
jgi:putative toxin-antitoxin system antitoxin component (TIGR02293 family)